MGYFHNPKYVDSSIHTIRVFTYKCSNVSMKQVGDRSSIWIFVWMGTVSVYVRGREEGLSVVK